MAINSVGQTNANDINMQSTNKNVQDFNGNINVKTDEKSKIQEQKYDKESLDKSLKKVNKFLEDDAAHAEYSVHKESGTIMIKIVDDKTKEVILEVPPKKILDMIASMCKQFGLIDKKA